MDVVKYSIFDTLTLEFIGFFKILNPNFPKFHDINLYKLTAKVEIILLSITVILSTISMYYSSNDINVFVQYLMLMVAYGDFALNHFYLIKNSNAIWDLMRVTNVNFLHYNPFSKKTFMAERFKHKLATTVTIIAVSTICICWIILPLFMPNNYLTINFKNQLYHYRCTAINYILPITDEFYNEHSNVFYAIETIMIISASHIAIFFDIAIITMCISIECQLKAISNSYSTFVFMNKHALNNNYINFNHLILNKFSLV